MSSKNIYSLYSSYPKNKFHLLAMMLSQSTSTYSSRSGRLCSCQNPVNAITRQILVVFCSIIYLHTISFTHDKIFSIIDIEKFSSWNYEHAAVWELVDRLFLTTKPLKIIAGRLITETLRLESHELFFSFSPAIFGHNLRPGGQLSKVLPVEVPPQRSNPSPFYTPFLTE